MVQLVAIQIVKDYNSYLIANDSSSEPFNFRITEIQQPPMVVISSSDQLIHVTEGRLRNRGSWSALSYDAYSHC